MTGIELIAAERKRQIEVEGWTAEHDAENPGELALAAACYATPAEYRDYEMHHTAPTLWPWESRWWKPGDRIRELSKAGALIAAELDRLIANDPDRERDVREDR